MFVCAVGPKGKARWVLFSRRQKRKVSGSHLAEAGVPRELSVLEGRVLGRQSFLFAEPNNVQQISFAGFYFKDTSEDSEVKAVSPPALSLSAIFSFLGWVGSSSKD